MQLSKRVYIIACAFVIAACGTPTPPAETSYDVVIRGGTVYDGTGGKPFVGDVAIRGERVVYVGPLAEGKGAKEIDARGKAVSPGFVNMLSWATESLLIDGRAQSNLRQGVTLEVFGEGATMGPLNPRMKEDLVARQGDLRYPVEWNTLGEFLEHLEKKGIAPNVASFVGAGTVRTHVLGEKDVQPTPEQLTAMRSLVRAAMEEGALGVGSGLQYMPDIYATTDELVALMEEAGRCGGMYITHMRSEGQYLLESIDETIEIARRSGTAAEIYHLKMSGQMYWNKLDAAIQRIEAARAAGVPVTADIYPYIASGTGLDVTMPPWVQEGGLDAWIARLKDPKIRKRVIAEMRAAKSTWENDLRDAGGPANVMLVGFKTERLKPLIGKTVEQVAKQRGVSAEDAIIDLIIEDGSKGNAVYFTMSEENLRREMALPWVSFNSDEGALSAEGIFLKSSVHPRAYGSYARVLGHYVRDEKVLSLEDAVRKMTSLPARNLGLRERGLLRQGYFADVVIFDPATIQDHATFEKPHQYSTGVSHVFVNGTHALADGEPTGAASGRFVRGRGWTGWPDGGCRGSSSAWDWTRGDQIGSPART
jgi:N-acyl-D-amino-acid deacylase